MEFAGIAAQRARLRDAIEARMAAVLDHCRFIRGPEVEDLEDRLARFVGVEYCVSCANGTDALQIALMALGIGRGDEVIVPAFSFYAPAEAVQLVGATPVFADIEPVGFTLDPRSVEASLGPRTRAIIPVSLFGQCADLDAIGRIAQAHGIPLIEDAAQSFGATRGGRRSCGLTTIACTSFFPSKPLGCYGDGGALFTRDVELHTRIASIAQHGQSERYRHERIGTNSRLDSLQAAVLLEKLAVFEEEIERRNLVADWYAREFEHGAVTMPRLLAGNTSVWAQYTVRATDRERVARELLSEGIPTAVHYPLPLHRQAACRADVALAQAEAAACSVLSLPMHPYLEREDVARVAAAVRRFSAASPVAG